MQFLWTIERVVFYGTDYLDYWGLRLERDIYHTTSYPEKVLIIQFADLGILIFELVEYCDCDCVEF